MTIGQFSLMSEVFDYAAIACNDVILVQHAISGGNFDVTIGDMLKRQNPRDATYAFEKGQHKYFVLHEESGLNFIVVGSLATQQQFAFTFLQRVQQAFFLNYSRRAWKDVRPYGLQSEFSDNLKQLMTAASKDNKIEKIRANLAETQEVMQDSMQKVLLRGNQLNNLDKTSETLAQDARAFDRNATHIRRSMWFKKYQWIILGVAIVVVILIIIIACASGDDDTQE